MTSDCIFCRIVEGTEPASVVYRDERVMAFMDIQPINPGHLLVVPLDHGSSLRDVPVEVAGRMMTVAHDAMESLRRSDLRTDGINLFLADGEAAGQEVFHAHLHVIPRGRGDGFVITPPVRGATTRAELDRIASHVADRFGRPAD